MIVGTARSTLRGDSGSTVGGVCVVWCWKAHRDEDPEGVVHEEDRAEDYEKQTHRRIAAALRRKKWKHEGKV